MTGEKKITYWGITKTARGTGKENEGKLEKTHFLNQHEGAPVSAKTTKHDKIWLTDKTANSSIQD